MNLEETRALETLKQIFLSETTNKQIEFERELEAIKYRLNNKDAKIDAYYPLVTELIEKKINEDESEVARVLSPVLGQALKNKISESKEEIIDALYPIMGETIRKTVSEGLKDFYLTLNQKIDNALKKGIFKSRVKSKLTGVSTTDILLKDVFPYSVQEVFLIHEKSGILLVHVSSKKSSSKSPDLIGGMLTAIKDFVGEAFKNETGEQSLYEIQYGDSKIVLERGRHSYLAIVIHGQEPIEFDKEIVELKEKIHNKYSQYLRNFDGDTSVFQSAEKIIKPFIEEHQFEKDDQNAEEKPRPILAYLFGFIFILLLVVFATFYFLNHINENKIDNLVKAHLTELPNVDAENINWEIDGNNLNVAGFTNSYNSVFKIDSSLRTIEGINVNNNIKVAYDYINQKAIIEKLDDIIHTPNFSNVKYELKNDKIYLSGTLQSERDELKLIDKIQKIKGIRVIVNSLKLNSVDDTDLITNTKINFNIGQISLDRNQKEKLDSILPIIKNSSLSELKITGFADGANNEFNRNIAQKRAELVKQYLINAGIDEKNIIYRRYSF